MTYYEFQFSYSSPVPVNILNDILANELGTIGFESFALEEDGLKAYIPVLDYDIDRLDKCLANFPIENTTINHTHIQIANQDWNEEWEKHYFQPIRIDKQCLIRASFHQPEEGYKYSIIIDPKMAFGTGNHATTYLMLSEILQLDLKDKELLDMGCGTAVLAILAAKKDAKRIVGIDIDEWAYKNALENCRLNHTEQIEIALGGAEQIKHLGTFDYIFANINRNILLNDIQYYAPSLKPNGVLFMSGFYTEDIPAIEAECNRNNLSLCSFKERDNWAAVKVKKNS